MFKSCLLLTLSFFLITITHAQKTYVPDDNFEQALIEQGYDDVPDDSVLTANISGVLHLVVNSKKISDLTGIEDFVSLLDIDCRDNLLTGVDLSNNTVLTSFNAGSNQITSLDLSHNPELTWLNCAENELNFLNFNQNNKLTFLKCDNNDLNSLDVRLLSKLEYLICEKNQIPVLDVSGKTNLVQLLCGNNDLTELDLNSSPALKTLECDSNKLVTLDIADCKVLETLNCSYNKITLLDMLNDSKLMYLTCSSNSLTGLDLGEKTDLYELTCSSNKLTSLDVTQCSSLTQLDFGANPISEIDLSKNSSLETLMFYFTSLTDIELNKNSALTMVYGAYNQLLRSLNINNGQNALVTYLDMTNCPNLNCIIVDNPADANNGVSPYDTWKKDSTATYASECTVAGNTYVPDNNFEQALIDLGIDDNATLNDSVPTANIYATTFLDISNKGISDLTGIEEFIYLDTLLVSDNQLTGLDISQNTKLKTLRCSNNQLDSINLRQNKLLTEIDCSDNQLEHLTIQTGTYLEKLYCNNNLLTEININDYHVLKELNCSNNRLTSLLAQNGTNDLIILFDATNNPDLTCIPVDNPTDANNGVAPYDVWLKDASATYSERCAIPGMTYIPDDFFEQALISLGIDKDGIVNDYVATVNIENITSLNIYSKGINDLTGIEDFASLISLNCNSNNLTSLNISHNMALKSLNCNVNHITELDVSLNDSLKTLYCGHNDLTNLDISSNHTLTSLYCEYNEITALDVSQDTLITNLDIANNMISDIDISNISSLIEFNCSNNEFSEIDISQNRALRIIGCYYNNLTSLDFSQNPELTTIYCSDNQLTGLNIKNGNNSKITHFDATNNPDLTCIMVDNAAAANAGMAPYDVWLTDTGSNYSIDCSSGINAYIPDDNFEQALIDLGIDSDGLLNDSIAKTDIAGVTELDLNNKNISDLTGIEYFTNLEKLLVLNNQLTTLDVRQNLMLKNLTAYNNHITSIDVKFNTYLDTLTIGFNKLTSLDVSKNNSLKLLTFNHNLIDGIDLSHNTELINLYCDANILYSLDVTKNIHLTQLRCASNQIYVLDVKNNDQLEYLSCNQNHLKELDLSENSALTELYCHSNELKSLNLTANTNLKTVYCYDNLLTNINTNGLTTLETIWCHENKLTDIDISENTGLRTLLCNDNLLSNLNAKNGNNAILYVFRAKNNPDLLCIRVDDPDAANSGTAPYDNWEKDAGASYSDDCTQETVINDANFEQALIDLGILSENSVDGRIPTDEITSVTKLDLSSLNITDLTGIADFTALDTLIVSDNQITYLDLTNNTNLVYVDVSNNPITTLLVTDSDIIKAASLTENTTNENLLSINISGTDIVSIDLSNLPNLETFIAEGSQLASLDVSDNSNLTVMDVRNCLLACIRVSQAQYDNIPAGWQKDDDASYSTDCNNATGINDKETVSEISLHPNPVSGILHITSAMPLSKVEFYTATGKLVKVVTTGFGSINLQNLQKGIYLVRVFTEESVTIRKLIKK